MENSGPIPVPAHLFLIPPRGVPFAPTLTSNLVDPIQGKVQMYAAVGMDVGDLSFQVEIPGVGKDVKTLQRDRFGYLKPARVVRQGWDTRPLADFRQRKRQAE